MSPDPETLSALGEMQFSEVFSVQIFFLIFREVLESAIIISVLLSFLQRAFASDNANSGNIKVYQQLKRQVWVGAFLGLAICFVIGGLFIVVFYSVGTNLWDETEKLWEAFFCIIASVMITIMGRSMLRMNKMQEKWRLKLAKLIINQETENVSDTKSKIKILSRKYAMALLPLVTTLREGLEAVVFLGGLGASVPLSSVPLAALSALALGSLVGYFMFKYGTTHSSVRRFIIGSTCFLYLVAAGLMSRGVWFYEMHRFVSKVGTDITENGTGPGSYDISNTVWHVDCCNPEKDGPYMIFNALLGWQNSATYGSVISYILYWVFVMLMVLRAMYHEQRAKRSMLATDDESHLIDRATNLLASTNG